MSELPRITPQTIRRDVDRLLAARERLRRRPVEDILAALDQVVRSWLVDDSPWRRQAETLLAARTGFAPAMLRAGLPRLLEPLRAEAIGRLLDEELGDRAPAATPSLVAHILPGNVPALAASAICLSLAVKASALVKPGSDERWFAPLFAASLKEVDEELAACVAVRCWAGGSREIEDEVFARADAVDVAGGDEAVAELRGRVRGRFAGRGARLSFAAIGAEVLADAVLLPRAAVAIAEDVAIWDQRGCLSPQVVLVETTSGEGLERVSHELAAALDDFARGWPPRSLSLDESASLLRFRQAAEWGVRGEPGARVLRGEGASWTILLERAAALRPTCLHRTVRLQPVADLAALTSLLAPIRARVEAAGLALDARRLAALGRELAAAGVPRVCAVGEMQRPDLTWKPCGLPRVASWM